jgi:hypothetical protein
MSFDSINLPSKVSFSSLWLADFSALFGVSCWSSLRPAWSACRLVIRDKSAGLSAEYNFLLLSFSTWDRSTVSHPNANPWVEKGLDFYKNIFHNLAIVSCKE